MKKIRSAELIFEREKTTVVRGRLGRVPQPEGRGVAVRDSEPSKAAKDGQPRLQALAARNEKAVGEPTEVLLIKVPPIRVCVTLGSALLRQFVRRWISTLLFFGSRIKSE